jgi:hypothetical protein
MAKLKLTREAILAAQLRTKEVDVPAWGGSVVISELPVGKRNELMAGMMDADGKIKVSPDIELRLFIAGMYDPEFTPADAAELQTISGAAVSMVAQEIMKLNGLSPDAQDEARGEF